MMDESDKLDAFIRGVNPSKKNKLKFDTYKQNGGFGAILDAIKRDMTEQEPVKEPEEKWGMTDINKRGL
jgi:hypothetical protein